MSMKTIKLLSLSIAVMGALFVQSCKDPCKDVICENGGTCDEETGICDCPENFYGNTCETECVNGTYSDGNCACDDYYEGDACKIEQREKFFGAFDVVEECTSGDDDYASTIKAASGTINRIEISYLYKDYPDGVIATVDGQTLTIPSQNPEEGFTMTGSGSISDDNNTITITYTLDDVSIGTVTCTTTFTRQ